MVLSSIRLVGCRKFIIHALLIRSYAVSAVAQVNSTPISSLQEDQSHYDHVIELDSLKVVDVLNRFRKQPIEALSFFNQLKQSGCSHDACTYAAIVRILCYWGLRSELDSLLLEFIRDERRPGFGFCFMDLFRALAQGLESDPHPNPVVLTQLSPALLKVYVNAGMLYAAIHVLLRTKSCGFVPCIFSCNFLLNFLVGCGEVELAVAIYGQLKRIGLSANGYTYTIMIKAFCVKGSFKEALNVLREMEEAGVTHAFAYSTYIEGLCKNGKTSLGFDALQSFIKAKVPLDVFAYTVVIRGFCRAGDPYKALELHQEMLSRGIKTNCVIATSILQGLYQRGMPSDVLDHFKAFKEKGILLNNAFYNVVINALCKMGEVEEAMALLIEMKGKQMVPDIVNYTTLIDNFFLKGRLSDARDLFVKMKENFHKLDIVAYNVIVGGLARNGLAGEAFGILNEMEAQGFEPNFVTHNMIIEGLCIGGKVKEAEAFFSNLEEKCSENYSAMINGYCKANCTNKAFDFFIRISKRIIVKKGSCLKLLHNLCTEDNYEEALWLLSRLSVSVNTTMFMYSKIIGLLCCVGKMEKAQSVFDYLVRRGHIPDLVIYTIMINGYCKMNCLMEAYYFLGDVKNRGIKPDVITYTVLIDKHCKTNNIQDAITLFNEMIDRGLEPDTVTYTALLSGHCNVGDIDKAEVLYNEMIDRGLEPDTVTYTALLSGHCNVGDIDKAEVLYNEMIERGLEPDTVTYTALLSGHCNAGDIDKAEILYNEMLDKGIQPDEDDRISKLRGILKARKQRSIRKHGATPGQQFEP